MTGASDILLREHINFTLQPPTFQICEVANNLSELESCRWKQVSNQYFLCIMVVASTNYRKPKNKHKETHKRKVQHLINNKTQISGKHT